MTVTLTESAVKAESQRLMRLQIIIDEVSKRAEESELVALLATSSQASRVGFPPANRSLD